MLTCNMEKGSRLKAALVLIHECTVDHLDAKDMDGCCVTDLSWGDTAHRPLHSRKGTRDGPK